MNNRIIIALLTLAAVTSGHAGTVAAQDCTGLQKLSLPGASVTAVEAVAAGALSVKGSPADNAVQLQAALSRLPAFCRVMVTAKPGKDSDIKIEVWLPAGWNGRLQAVGDGGLAGYIPYALMAQAMAEGYATTGTDTGHVGASVDFMPAYPDKLLDFAYR